MPSSFLAVLKSLPSVRTCRRAASPSEHACVCQPPPRQDIAIVTGAEYVAKDLGMSVATTGVEALGTARKVRGKIEIKSSLHDGCSRRLSALGLCLRFARRHTSREPKGLAWLDQSLCGLACCGCWDMQDPRGPVADTS